jgi:hypothetical protein
MTDSHPFIDSALDDIIQIVSYEYYGIFVNLRRGTAGNMYFIEIEPDKIIARNGDGTLAYTGAKLWTYPGAPLSLKYDYTALTDTTKTLGLRVRDDAKTTWCPSST